MLYVARTVDMFVSVRALTLKSIISTYVDTAELGKKYSCYLRANLKITLCSRTNFFYNWDN